MDIKEFDKVLLKTGETAYIVEIYEQGVAYEADIDKVDGTVETDTIKHADIEKIFSPTCYRGFIAVKKMNATLHQGS